MFKDIIMGITCILLGGFTFSFWCFAMFSDSDWGELAREMLDGGFNLGRNTIAVIEPALGLCFLFGGLLGLADPVGVNENNPVRSFLTILVLAMLVVAVLGLIPVRLVLPSGLALENGWPIKRMKVFKAGGTDDVVFWVNRHV